MLISREVNYMPRIKLQCPYCDWKGIYLKEHNLKVHKVSELQLVLDYNKLTELPKCKYSKCNNSVKIKGYGFTTYCSKGCITRDKVENGESHLFKNGDPEHDKHVSELRSKSIQTRIANGTLAWMNNGNNKEYIHELHVKITRKTVENGNSKFKYSGNPEHDLLVKEFHQKSNQKRIDECTHNLVYNGELEHDTKLFKFRSELAKSNLNKMIVSNTHPWKYNGEINHDNEVYNRARNNYLNAVRSGESNAEKLFKSKLDELKVNYIQNFHDDRFNHKYKIDFYFPELNHGIEIDGELFHDDERDKLRDEIIFNTTGIKIKRIKIKDSNKLTIDKIRHIIETFND